MGGRTRIRQPVAPPRRGEWRSRRGASPGVSACPVAAVPQAKRLGRGEPTVIAHLKGRERALVSFGLTGRRAEWIALASLHGGVFTRAQLSDWLGASRLQVLRLVQALTERRLVAEETVGGLKVCRICARGIYRALGAQDVRIRKIISPEVVIRRLLSFRPRARIRDPNRRESFGGNQATKSRNLKEHRKMRICVSVRGMRIRSRTPPERGQREAPGLAGARLWTALADGSRACRKQRDPVRKRCGRRTRSGISPGRPRPLRHYLRGRTPQALFRAPRLVEGPPGFQQRGVPRRLAPGR